MPTLVGSLRFDATPLNDQSVEKKVTALSLELSKQRLGFVGAPDSYGIRQVTLNDETDHDRVETLIGEHGFAVIAA